MEKQKIGKLHRIIKRLKHGLDENDILNKNMFLEANQKYVKIMERAADILIFIFSPLFILFFLLFYIPMPVKIEELIDKYSLTLLLFFTSISFFFCFLIIKIEIGKFKRYIKTKNEDKDIDY